MKHVKIFLASSVNEFADERLILKDFTRRLSNALIDGGVRIKLFMCEYADNAIAYGRKQAEYNREIEDSDLFMILIGQRLGEYTLEEYEYALSERGAKGLPVVFAAFLECAHDETVAAFKRRIVADNVFACSFKTAAELKAALAEAAAESPVLAGKLSVKDGGAFVDGKYAARL